MMLMTDEEKVRMLRQCLLGVIACFTSRTESSTCINDHHPSCLAYAKSVIFTVDSEGD